MRQRVQQIGAVQCRQRRAYVGFRRLRPGEPDVVQHGAGEQEIVLLHAPHLRPQRIAGDRVQVRAVHQHASARRQIKFLQQPHQRCLAAAGVPHQSDVLSRLGHKRNVPEHRPPRLILEMHRPEFHAAFDGRQRFGRGRVHPLRFLVQHPEQPFRAGHCHERLVQLIADGLHRIEEQVGQEQEHHQVAHLHVQPAVPVQHAVPAQQRHRAEEKLALQLQQRHEHRRRLRHAHVVLAVDINQFTEEVRINFMPHKRLRHPDAAYRFGQRRGDPAPGFLHLAQPPAHLAPVVLVHHPDERRHDGHQRKQLPIVVRHQRRRGRHLQPLHHQHERHVLRPGPHAVNVRCHPADDAAKFGLVEKRHRHCHQLAEQIRPHVVHHRLAQFEREPLAEMKIHDRDQGQCEIPRRIPENPRQIPVRDRPGDGAANQPRQRRQLQAADEGQSEKPVPLGCVRLRVMENPADECHLQRRLVRLALLHRIVISNRLPRRKVSLRGIVRLRFAVR